VEGGEGQRLVAAEFGRGLHADLVGAAEAAEVVDLRPAQEGLEGGEDIVQRHAQLLGLFAVDLESQAGVVALNLEKIWPISGRWRAAATKSLATCDSSWAVPPRSCSMKAEATGGR
jgi:hypothetical protein